MTAFDCAIQKILDTDPERELLKPMPILLLVAEVYKPCFWYWLEYGNNKG